MIKVDKLHATVERALEKRSVAATARMVSSKTIETFARELAALHKPVQVDWAARFGLRAEVAPPIKPASVGMAVPTSLRAICVRCERQVSDKVVEFCRANREQFGGATYCFDCQKYIRAT